MLLVRDWCLCLSVSWPLSPGGHHAASSHFFLLSHSLQQKLGRNFGQKCEGSFSSPPTTLFDVGLEAAPCTSPCCCGVLSCSMHSFPRRSPSVSDCPQGTLRSSCPSTLGWHCCFACAPCGVSLTCAGHW